MKLELCTLFDSNYLDKGLVCYKSLLNVCDDFMLYILPMDSKCSEVLNDLKLEKTIIIDFDDFEDEDLKKVKATRGRAEFCWTCTPKLIHYIFSHYSINNCTYIDADMYFYRNPVVLLQEMLNSNCSVQIIKHNFPFLKRRKSEDLYGIFCVEYNTFLNNEKGLEVLIKWENDCINECSYHKNKKVFGDQKYLNEWPQIYDCVNISRNQGAGVAPWNINKFLFYHHIYWEVRDLESSKEYDLIFYHFQNIRFLDSNHVYCCPTKKRNYTNIECLYKNYIDEIIREKFFLRDSYGINSFFSIHPAEAEMDKKKNTIIDILYLIKEHIIRKINIVKDVIISIEGNI